MLIPSTTSRKLEDRIRLLCIGAVAAEEDACKPILEELKAALKAHSECMRQMLEPDCLLTSTETACE